MIHTDAPIGLVALSVKNLNRSLRFYQNALGLKIQRRESNSVHLGVGRTELLLLQEMPNGSPTAQTTSLYHYALLVPTRYDLAAMFWHFLRTRTPLNGFADHAVSEAIYLQDPDGHGIEICWDRPREAWPYAGGQLKMSVDPLDAEGLLAELGEEELRAIKLPVGTVMGHIHLRVAHLGKTAVFYEQVLGFEVMARVGETAAVFLAVNGYHHHIGLSKWAGTADSPSLDGAWQMPDRRLLWFEVQTTDLAVIQQRLEFANVPFSLSNNRIHVADPAGNQLHLVGQN